MTKRELIDEIMRLNRTARPAFLAEFGEVELQDYLRHLQLASLPRMRSANTAYDTCLGGAARTPAKVTLDAIVHKAWQSERAQMFASPLAALEAFQLPAVPSEAGDDDYEDADEVMIDSADTMEEDIPSPGAMDDGIADDGLSDEAEEPNGSAPAGNAGVQETFLY